MIVTSLDPVRLADADLFVANGRIAAPGEGERVDTDDALVIPGNVNAHTHLYSALARGMPSTLEAPTTFLEILQRVWWRLDRALDEESIRVSALVAGTEALLAGTTTVVDHHSSPNAIDGSLDVIEEALASLGIRSVLCYEVSDRDGADRARRGIEENRRFLARELPLCRALSGAHACFTLSHETLAACAELGPLHIHAAEDRVDHRPVARLAEAHALDAGTLLAHCIHLDVDELELVQETSATVAHNARSNMHNGVGHANVRALGAHVALGTDGIGADLFEEARAAYFRLREDDVEATLAWPLERVAEGARFVGRMFGEPLLGTLEPGAPADLVVLDYAAPGPLDESNLAGHWLFGIGSRNVRHVMVAGDWVVWDRGLVHVDQEQVGAEAWIEAERLGRRLAGIPPHAFAPEMVRS